MTYTQPLLLLFSAIALVGLVRIRRCHGVWLPATGVLMLALLAWPPVAWILSRPLEARYPIRPFKANSDYDAIVVLSSAVTPPQFEHPYALPDEETFDRILFTSWIYNKRPVPVLICGGRGGRAQEPYSASMRDLLLKFGVPGSVVWTEERSTSTHQNAAYGAEILKRHGIHRAALVADATSMPRAAACFRKEGIVVVCAPSGFYEPADVLIPTWKAIRQNELTLHEVLGLAWYRIRGWI